MHACSPQHNACSPPDSPPHCAKLRSAVRDGNEDLVKHLLARGACVHEADGEGWTAVHIAAVHGWADVTRALLQHGADAQRKDKMLRTPLHLVTRSGNLEVAELLLKHGAPVAAQNHAGKTALHDAAFRGIADLVHLMVHHARDPLHLCMLTDDLGMTALQSAAHRGHEKVVLQLLPVVLSAPVEQAATVLKSAAVAATTSSYPQVAVQLLKHLHRVHPAAVLTLMSELHDQQDDLGSSLLTSLIPKWVAECADLPAQQAQLQHEQQTLSVSERRIQALCLVSAAYLHGRLDVGSSSSSPG